MGTPAGRLTEARPVPAELVAGLVRLGLVEPAQPVLGAPVTGGVSSEIWRADLREGTVCVKKALERLRVEATWSVPRSRTGFEAAWLAAAGAVLPEAVCPLIGFAAEEGVLVLRWLPPDSHPVWKAQLMAGNVDAAVAAELGRRLAAIHAALSDPGRYRAGFASADLFGALRIDPYLRVTAERHPERRRVLEYLAARTAAIGSTVIHGDVSPKNVLVGPSGPLLIDAECATWGDPAFDVAFCANHLFLKAVLMPEIAGRLRQAFDAFTTAYLAGVTWEPVGDLDARAGSLLPALALARVDGTSPVEYLDEVRGRPEVRAWTKPLLDELPARMADAAAVWFDRAAAAVAR